MHWNCMEACFRHGIKYKNVIFSWYKVAIISYILVFGGRNKLPWICELNFRIRCFWEFVLMRCNAVVVLVLSVDRWRGVARREVFPAGGTVADSRQALPCRNLRIQQGCVNKGSEQTNGFSCGNGQFESLCPWQKCCQWCYLSIFVALAVKGTLVCLCLMCRCAAHVVVGIAPAASVCTLLGFSLISFLWNYLCW